METNFKSSPFAWGLWRLVEANLDQQQLYQLIVSCLDAGITTFDHADIYGDGQAQVQFGQVLLNHPELRAKMKIVSKCGIKRTFSSEYLTPSYYDTSYDHIIESVKQSIADLHCDYLDTLLIHRVDYLADYDEIARAFTDLKQQGLVKEFGVSNFLVPQLLAMKKAYPEIVVNQIELSVEHLEHFENGVLEKCYELGIGVMAYSPLGGGRIFGEDYHNMELKECLMRLASEYGVSGIDKVMLAWLRKHPANITVILGSMKQHRLLEALDSEKIKLTNRQWYECMAKSRLERLP